MESPSLIFVHRHNRDGTYDSICKTCHATVCTALNEADLQPLENGHECSPAKLEYLRRLANTSRRFD